MLDSLLAWGNLVFYIPLVVGLLLVVGMALGVADTGHDLEGHAELGADGAGHVGADGGHDAGGHDTGGHGDGGHGQAGGHGSAAQGLLSLLGFGRVPLMILLTTLCLLFGGSGIILNNSLGALGIHGGWAGWISLPGALVCTLVVTPFLARLVARLMPTTETASMSKEDLFGCTGTLILPSDRDSGLVQVRRGGDVYQLPCRSAVPLAKGTTVLVTDYDDPQRAYSVCVDPTLKED
jgi:membrane protein implicated in regulation of membrane protease activity